MINKGTYTKPIAFVLTLLLVFSIFTPMVYVYGADVTDALVTDTQPSQAEENAPVKGDDTALSAEETGDSSTSDALPVEEVNDGGTSTTTPSGEEVNEDMDTLVPLAAPLMLETRAPASDISGWLKSLLSLTIKQNGNTLPPGGQLTPDQSFEVTGKFSTIPLQDSDTVLNPGDWAILDLDQNLSLVPDTVPVSYTLEYFNKKIGTLTFEAKDSGDPSKGLQARIVFDGEESIWKTYTDIEKLQFSASLKYNGSGIGEGDPEKDIVILGKTYKIYKPIIPIEPNISKTGSQPDKDGEILWTVTVDAKKGEQSGQSLKDMIFTDDLSQAGTYVDDSFKIDNKDLTESEEVNFIAENNKITYTFGDVAGPKVITYKTKLTDDEIKKIGLEKMTFKNKATLNGKTDAATVTVDTVPQIKKVGRVDEDIDGNKILAVDYKNRIITWYIEVNQQKAERTNLTVTDILPTELTFQKAKWQKYNGTAWVDAGSVINPAPADGKYVYDSGNTTSDHLRLIIETKYIVGSGYITDNKNIENKASVTWNGMPSDMKQEGKDSVGVGFDILTKGGTFDSGWASNHLVNWTINLDFKGQFKDKGENALENFKIYDLLVHDDNKSGFKIADYKDNLVDADGHPVTVDSAILSELTPQYGQRYAAEIAQSTSPAGLNIKQIKVMKDGKHIADLIEISGFSADQAYQVKFSSKMLNPADFIKNGTAVAHNTATLFEGTTEKKYSTASPSKSVGVLAKSVLPGTVKEDALNGSTAAGSSENGFNHDTKTAFFRLNINASGQNLTDTEFNSSPITVTDKLPAGWEFDQSYNTKGYKIFDGNAPAAELTGLSDPVSGKAVFGEEGDRETLTFTYNQLDKHYVILVKAKLTDEQYAKYIEENTTSITVQNDAEFAVGGITVKSDAQVKVKTGMVSKNVAHPQDGKLKWTIDYNPLAVKAVSDHEKVTIKDTLSKGFELRLDENNDPYISNSGSDEGIYIEEMVIQPDGTLAEQSSRNNLAKGLVEEEKLTYDISSRELKIQLPDGKKAYRVTYVTLLTGEESDTVRNDVLVEGITAKQSSSEKTYQISDSDASAMLVLGGYLRIKKTGENGAPLADAKFALYVSGGKKIREGQTDENGILRFGALRPDTYTLQEIEAPDGYVIDGRTYTVTVEDLDGGSPIQTKGKKTTILLGNELKAEFNKSTPDSTAFEVKNYKSDTIGNLTVQKTVAGNAGDRTKQFIFTVTFADSPNVNGTYLYIGTGGKENGEITVADNKMTFTLKDGQSVTIHSLPKNAQYTVTENDYSGEGYVVTPQRDITGTIEAGKTQTASFTNTKSTGGGGGGGGGETPTKPGITTEPGVTTGPGVTTKPAINTPESVYGSIRIVKIDGENPSRTLSGAVFQLFNGNGKLVQTSAATGNDGVAVFSGLEAGQKYYLKETTTPEGYQSSGQTYSFQLSKDAGNRDVSVTFRNTKEGNGKIVEIDPEQVPKGWIIEEEKVPTGGLDTTPKTGSSDTPLLMVFSLAVLTGTGLLISGIQVRRRRLSSFRKDK